VIGGGTGAKVMTFVTLSDVVEIFTQAPGPSAK
jgi:hypothetical protein